MEAIESITPVHALGIGRIAVPVAERDSRRYGTVLLLDGTGAPVRLREVPVGIWAALTLVKPAARAARKPNVVRWHLLGAGPLFTQPTVWEGKPVLAVGVEPANQRFTGWLDVPARADLAEQPVWLEAHPAWPCPCIPTQARRRGRRGGGRR